MGKLDGKVAIVSGASRGLGKAIAQLFAAEGAKVVCSARTLNEGDRVFPGSLNTTVSEIQKAGGTALAVQTQVAEEEDCIRLVETAKQTFGPVDVLVNDARYMSPFFLIKDCPLKHWVRSFAVNVQAAFVLSREVLPDMIERRSGAIINISSGAARGPGRGPYPHSSDFNTDIKFRSTETRSRTMYGATKAALERFTQGLAEEVYQYGITVAAVSPSLAVPTPRGVYYGRIVPNDPETEPPDMMARATLLLATEPLDKVTGRVTYSQAILKEFGWIDQAKGTGVDQPGSGYSQI